MSRNVRKQEDVDADTRKMKVKTWLTNQTHFFKLLTCSVNVFLVGLPTILMFLSVARDLWLVAYDL